MESINLIDRKIKFLTAQDSYIQKNVTRLQTIPGVGLFSAAVLLSEIRDFLYSASRNSWPHIWALIHLSGNPGRYKVLGIRFLSAVRLMSGLCCT